MIVVAVVGSASHMKMMGPRSPSSFLAIVLLALTSFSLSGAAAFCPAASNAGAAFGVVSAGA
jgi:hypothetical protein